MTNSKKLNELLTLLCSDVRDAITENPSDAISYIDSLDAFENIRGLFSQAIANNGSNLDAIISASAMSDVFWIICQCLVADNDVTARELDRVADILSESLHKYCWIEDYRRFAGWFNAGLARQLLSYWQDDSSWLGGDVEGGAILRPFSTFVVLTCFLKRSATPHQTYSKAILFIAKLVLEADGIVQDEIELFKELNDSLNRQSLAIQEAFQDPDQTIAHSSQAVESDTTNEPVITPDNAYKEGIEELNNLVGVDLIKAEVSRLTNFLKIRQQRLSQGLPVSSQALHFVFTGNAGTGKTTVARILAKLLYGFGIIKSPTVTEVDRAALVGGYVGQTAIKTNDVITKAMDGVLFIDEAYTLLKGDREDYGRESIETLLKRMEDLRNRLVVIVAGYPDEMRSFISSNPGLESRFTRYIHFSDYEAPDLCQIFERLCTTNAYQLTQAARGNLAILLNHACNVRDSRFGNARYVRNAFEITLGNHSDRLARKDAALSRHDLSTIEVDDLPYQLVTPQLKPFDLTASRWLVRCPGCEKTLKVTLQLIGQLVTCKCGASFRCPWWNLDASTVDGLNNYTAPSRPGDLIGYDLTRKVVNTKQ